MAENQDDAVDNVELQKLIDDVLEKVLEIEPEQGDTFESIQKSKRINIESTKLRRLKHEMRYRVLFPKRGTEIAMIISDNVSDTAMKAGLLELTSFSNRLQSENLLFLTAGAQIYLEYEQLNTQHNWSWEKIEQQIAYDLLLTFLILNDENPDKELYQYALAIQEAIIEYLRIKRKGLDDFITNSINSIKEGKLPFFTNDDDIPSNSNKLKYARECWKNELSRINYVTETRGLLLSFWLVSFLKGYWTKLDNFRKVNEFNKKNRNSLMYLFFKQVSTQIHEFSSPENLPEVTLRNLVSEFLRKIQSEL